MEIQLELIGTDADEDTALALRDWLQKEQISGLLVERKSAPPKESHMGIEPLSILSIILGSAAIVELVRSIHVWIEVRKPKLRLKLRRGQSEVEIEVENLASQKELIESVLAKLNEAKE